MKSFTCIGSVLFVLLTLFLTPVNAQDENEEKDVVTLPEVVVQGRFEREDFVGPLFTETNTKTKITEKGIGALGPTSMMSVPKAINLIPSVHQQSVDPLGLGDISNYHESFRFRGIEPTGGGNPSTPVNMENVPMSARPGGGANIYDMENFSSISIYKGGVPAEKGFGLTNIGGKIDMEVKRPEEDFGFNLKQTLGSHDARRTFLRLDSGILPSQTAGFLSYSNTAADKWKGEGDSKRQNAMLGLRQMFGDRLKFEFFSSYNKTEANPYRPLDFEQASSLGENYDSDFSDNRSDYFYYGYNKNKFEDHNILANIEYAVTENSKITLKPFYWNDKGYYQETITMKNGQNRIRRWDIDHNLNGVQAEYSVKLLNALDFDIGYFYLEQERPGPPTSWKLYTVSDGRLVFDKWQILSNSSHHRQKTPFVSGKYAIGRFQFEAGMKYLNYSMPSITTYNTQGIPDVSYESALGMATTIEASASVQSKDFHEILPNAGVSYVLTDSLSCYFSYGRNYGMSVALYPYFISQKSAFDAKGITLQDLWDNQELEIADNFDFGFRYITDKLYIVPTIYYAKHKNKTAIYYDASLDATFPAAIFDADAYGFELEAGAMPLQNLSIYASFSYNRFYFSQDISNKAGETISVDGNQVPDAPEFLVKGMVSYRLGDFSFSPVVRYCSSRYGDILQEEKIDDAVVFDFDVTYSKAFPQTPIKKMDISLSLNNIFDKEYISIINTADYQTLGSSYHTGAPFTMYATVSLSF
ncbi:TonB-dependent receptor [Desulfosarcina ovata subsp. sediminis]|uniref:TonB-dependent receptor n=1 Tax=Desulfosarcina ovata subsp. sediminis TaxID=885957 RepID=A0A5K7ZT42_9BACT|nr:TonB-dependent receptor [Desulfosarcina ovata]BBO83401.1 TonB-dependent receptor [Desulfosarcina ovata subsp. sediminis]